MARVTVRLVVVCPCASACTYVCVCVCVRLGEVFLHVHVHGGNSSELLPVADLYRAGRYPTTAAKERVVCLVTLAMLLLARGGKAQVWPSFALLPSSPLPLLPPYSLVVVIVPRLVVIVLLLCPPHFPPRPCYRPLFSIIDHSQPWLFLPPFILVFPRNTIALVWPLP